MTAYCRCNYFCCPIAILLNREYQQFKLHTCRYNKFVNCLHTDECEKCGWNPDVAQERRRRLISSGGYLARK